MKAIVQRRGGPSGGPRCEEVDKPAPGDREVLIRVHAASINPLDWRMRAKRPGRDVAGQVEAVGANITSFRAGDDVFGACRGAFAEFACASASSIVVKPPAVTFEQAASAPVAGLTALQALRDKGRIQAGQNVLVNGAAGGVGTFAVQIAKSFDATVTGVCSTKNLEMVRSIGADRVVDYTNEDFTAGRDRYELILDCVGDHSMRACRRVLTPRGTYVTVGGISQSIPGIVGSLIAAPLWSLVLSQRFVPFIAKSSTDDLAFLGELMASGKVTPVIDRRYPLSGVPEALRYAAQKRARGKIVITIAA